MVDALVSGASVERRASSSLVLGTTSKIFSFRAENEARTRDPNLGKVMLYQLSYFRKKVVQ